MQICCPYWVHKGRAGPLFPLSPFSLVPNHDPPSAAPFARSLHLATQHTHSGTRLPNLFNLTSAPHSMATYTTIPALSPASPEFPLPSLQTTFYSSSSILHPPSRPTGSSPSSPLGGRSGAFATAEGVTFGDSSKENSFAYSHGAVNGTTRDEVPPHEGPGSAVYVRQPTRSQLVSRPFASLDLSSKSDSR